MWRCAECDPDTTLACIMLCHPTLFKQVVSSAVFSWVVQVYPDKGPNLNITSCIMGVYIYEVMNKCFNTVSTFANPFLYRVFVLFIRSSSSESLLTLESSSNYSCSDTPGLLPTSAIILATCRLWSLCTWSLLRMCITMYNTGDYCTVALWEHLFYAHLEYRINHYILL